MFGRMVGNMKVSIKMIKSMGMAFILGVIKRSIQVGGLMENNMDWEFSFQKKGNKRLVYGKMERR